jgi:hypothetical protein
MLLFDVWLRFPKKLVGIFLHKVVNCYGQFTVNGVARILQIFLNTFDLFAVDNVCRVPDTAGVL